MEKNAYNIRISGTSCLMKGIDSPPVSDNYF